MKKIYGRSLKRALALSVALVMSLTPALAATTVESRLVCGQQVKVSVVSTSVV